MAPAGFVMPPKRSRAQSAVAAVPPPESSSECDGNSSESTAPDGLAPDLKSSHGLSHAIVYRHHTALGSSHAKTRKFFTTYDGGYKVSNGTIDLAVANESRRLAAMADPNLPKVSAGRNRVLDQLSMQFLANAANRELARNSLIRPTPRQCLILVDFAYWKQQQRLSQQMHISKPSARHPGKLFTLKTYNTIIHQIWPETDKVDSKAHAREDAKAEIRNMISTAAVAMAEFTGTNPDAIFSSDIFTLQRNERGQSVLVRMAAGSKHKLKGMGLTAGFNDDSSGEAFRVLPIMASIAMSGHLLSAIAIIHDDQLPDGSIDIIALDSMGGEWDNAVLFVAYCGPNIAEEVLYHKMFVDVVFPKSIKRVDQCKAMIRGGAKRPEARHFSISPDDAHRLEEAFTSPSTSASRPATRSAQAQGVRVGAVSVNSVLGAGGGAAAARPVLDMPPQASSHPRPLPPPERMLPGSMDREWDVTHCFDGDCPQVKAAFNKACMKQHGLATLRAIAILLAIRLIKWAAGCSMLMSPNDKGAMHYLAKNAFKQMLFETCCINDSNTPLIMRNHKAYFFGTNMLAASKKTYWTLLSNMPWILNRAFTIATVQSGWEKCGYYPTVDVARIMEQYSGWSDGTLTAEQSDMVMSTINSPQAPLVVIARREGRTADIHIDRLLPFLEPVFSIAHALEEMAFSRDRTVVFTKPGYFEFRERNLQALLIANPDMARTGQARRLSQLPSERLPATVSWFLNPSNILAPPSTETIKEQLALRRIQHRNNSGKGKLLELWMEHDQSPSEEFWRAHRSKPGAPQIIRDVPHPEVLSPVHAARARSPPAAAAAGGGGAAAVPRRSLAADPHGPSAASSRPPLAAHASAAAPVRARAAAASPDRRQSPRRASGVVQDGHYTPPSWMIV